MPENKNDIIQKIEGEVQDLNQILNKIKSIAKKLLALLISLDIILGFFAILLHYDAIFYTFVALMFVTLFVAMFYIQSKHPFIRMDFSSY
jgi:hypothetical protein